MLFGSKKLYKLFDKTCELKYTKKVAKGSGSTVEQRSPKPLVACSNRVSPAKYDKQKSTELCGFLFV